MRTWNSGLANPAVAGVVRSVPVADSGRAGNRVHHVVPATRRMIDRIPAAAGGATLERAELVDQARIVEQLDAPAIDQRQQVDVELALGPGRGLVENAEFSELLDRPRPSIVISLDSADVVAFQQPGKLVH